MTELTAQQLIVDNELWQQLELALMDKQYQFRDEDYPVKLETKKYSISMFELYEALCHYQQLNILTQLREEQGFSDQRYSLARFVEAHKTQDYLPLIRYYLVSLRKYGASFEYLTVEEMLQLVKQYDEEMHQQLVDYGSGELPPEKQTYQSQFVSCMANDMLATITIQIKVEHEQAYREAMMFINDVLAEDFPHSFAIVYEGEGCELLPVPELPVTSSHHFFAKVLSYPDLRDALVEYSYKAMKRYHFYGDVDDEQAAMPGTFAVFGLGMLGKQYGKLVIDYMCECDGDHSPMPELFAKPYVEKFGLDQETMPVFICTALSMQELSYDPVFEQAIANDESLALLERFMAEPLSALCEDLPPEYVEQIEEIKDLAVANLLYTLFNIVDMNDTGGAEFQRIPEPYRTRYAQHVAKLV